MKSGITISLSVLIMVSALHGMRCLPGYGEESYRAELANQIREKIEKLELVRSQIREQRATFQQEQQRVDAQISRLRQQLTETRNSGGFELPGVPAEGSMNESVSHVSLQQAVAANIAGLQPVINRIKTVIKRLPYRERTAWLEQLNKAQLQCGSDDQSEQLAGVQTLFDVVDEIFPHIDAIQLTNAPVTLPDGRMVHSYVLRLGILTSMFVSEDGSFVGIAHRNAGGDWIHGLSGKKADAVRTAVAIVRKQGKPVIATVPLQLIETDWEGE